MRIEADEPCPLPDDPVLAEWATAMRDMGEWGWIVDSSWRLKFVTDELRLSFAGDVEMVPVVIGEHMFGSEMEAVRAQWRFGPTGQDSWQEFFTHVGGWVLSDTAGGKTELKSIFDPSLAELIDEIVPSLANVTIETTFAGGTSQTGGDPPRRFGTFVGVVAHTVDQQLLLDWSTNRARHRSLRRRCRRPGGSARWKWSVGFLSRSRFSIPNPLLCVRVFGQHAISKRPCRRSLSGVDCPQISW